MKTSIIGYPRIGSHRELKFRTEEYFKKELEKGAFEAFAKELRKHHWHCIDSRGIDFIPSNDFSHYDNLLDTAYIFNIIPQRYKDLDLNGLDTYFAMARGYQDEKGDVRALPMKKWFNTNYHYIVPEIEETADIRLSGEKPFAEFREALDAGIMTKPVIIGPFTLLKLSDFKEGKSSADFAYPVIAAYQQLLAEFGALNAEWVQFDEPSLVTDLTAEDKALFLKLYSRLLKSKKDIKILLQTYFGDIRDVYNEVIGLDFDAVGLDFIEGEKSFELIEKNGFPPDKLLFAGVINGKNIWRSDYRKTLFIVKRLNGFVAKDNIVLSTSCSLLHVPYTVNNETGLSGEYREHLAFAEEKLTELSELRALLESESLEVHPHYVYNRNLFDRKRTVADNEVGHKISALKAGDFTRLPPYEEREIIQRRALRLPLFPSTTIGSFPQTDEIKSNRAKYKHGEITKEQYVEAVKAKIARCIRLQEDIGLDVLVHGEFERNDMVEFFGENLSGFVFTTNAWVQSYGTRCVKPPIIWSDIRRHGAITTDYIKYAQSLTGKPVKGMLTGPVTILNWSFSREDISQKKIAFQIALAIREEVLELEECGIRIIQIDEAALKEKLPIRREDWHKKYLDWAIPAFRLVHSGVKAKTQIHTHMCYSEFGEIIREIDEMDADVISFEASRSQLGIVGQLKGNGFKTQVGPGVYDIHSPRIPPEEEIADAIKKMLEEISPEKLWVNPDCGLKTRGEPETISSLINLVNAARKARDEAEAE